MHKQGLRVALIGPASIEVIRWKSRSRANIFNLKEIPDALFLLVLTIVGIQNPDISTTNIFSVILSCAPKQHI